MLLWKHCDRHGLWKRGRGSRPRRNSFHLSHQPRLAGLAGPSARSRYRQAGEPGPSLAGLEGLSRLRPGRSPVTPRPHALARRDRGHGGRPGCPRKKGAREEGAAACLGRVRGGSQSQRAPGSQPRDDGDEDSDDERCKLDRTGSCRSLTRLAPRTGDSRCIASCRRYPTPGRAGYLWGFPPWPRVRSNRQGGPPRPREVPLAFESQN